MGTKRKRMDFSQEPPATLDDSPFYGYKLDEEQLGFANAIYSKDIDIVFCNSSAGTGKSLVAIGTANMMVQYGMYDEIYYIISPYGERKQGYLPGDIQAKSVVYFEPLYQALVSLGINPSTSVNQGGMESGLGTDKSGAYITCITDTYLRGVNLSGRKIVILDETQNFDFDQLKKTLTRIGKDTKVICIGHVGQIDLDRPNTSGFASYLDHFNGCKRAKICELKTNHRGWVSQHADELEINGRK